ncbi:hypothetical protein HanRHA438_Chr09g0391401 [Helianthus annuus]|uniref:Uncharacterized protein n=1 Tax=Helianthus annuus TaxID=4232 RepID=A0A251S271_HELAN|nr:hypothetical protein HanXRQr2_Chr16g0767711 [Helianthus annuus]KAF5761667.1 hypothetical protein HanXRQr2_Chr16g0767721 [Helianthus annuus]KAJ0439469.1 hypothetical protein HanHA300_Chr16g0625661 [Helianthus annuus]KAJ0439470.1 hypothetical protein HanHA300_Chr16g0625671 [Helianthus annuus]KAJ0444566.1 hypothetical protein HanIR_Chr16g0833221 [Helianthus annuus]
MMGLLMGYACPCVKDWRPLKAVYKTLRDNRPEVWVFIQSVIERVPESSFIQYRFSLVDSHVSFVILLGFLVRSL